jgi:hypothetical protein
MKDGAHDRSMRPASGLKASPAASRVVETVCITWRSVPQMRYQTAYLWFVLFSSLDIILTWIILSLEGTEINPVARLIIDTWSLPGAVAFKFSLVLFVVIVCEVVGRRVDRKGRWLARIAVVVSAVPVFYSLGLLAYHIRMVSAIAELG